MTASPTNFKKESGFIWSMMGSAIGFANLLCFSAQCYKNGGGAFLIPFILAMALVGLPMLVLEGTIGNKMRLPIVSAFGVVAGRTGKVFGWLSIIAVATIGAFYAVLTGYSVAYAYFSATSSVPSDTSTFFMKTFLQDSGSPFIMGAFSIPIFLATAAVCLFSCVVLGKNIRSGVERLCSTFLPLLCILVALFATVVAFLPGALEGFAYYLRPDFSKLANPALWRDVFGQVFFSFSLGLGIVTGYSRHTGSTTSIARAMLFVALGDFLVSLIAGFAIFGCVGYLSTTTGTPVSSLIQSDSSFEMGFVIFPMILKAFGPILEPIVGVLFFFCVFIAGITGVFSIMESIMGNIQLEFGRKRTAAAFFTTALLFVMAIPFCFGMGQPLIGALAPMVLGNNMLIGGLAEIAVFMYLAKEIRDEEVWLKGSGRTLYYHLLRLFVPLVLALILISSVMAELAGGIQAPQWISWGWLGGALLLSYRLSARRAALPTQA
ncbi:MAG: sodium-dependent transporter [Parachlamydiales bacterium]